MSKSHAKPPAKRNTSFKIKLRDKDGAPLSMLELQQGLYRASSVQAEPGPAPLDRPRDELTFGHRPECYPRPARRCLLRCGDPNGRMSP